MWLTDGEAHWDPTPEVELRGTELALRLLLRTQELVGAGDYWRGEALALDSGLVVTNPLSEDAKYFSLGGAAARARWEMREELADAEVSPVHVRQVMNAIFAVTRDYEGLGGWTFAVSVLDGMRFALEQYRESQIQGMAA